MYTSLVTAKEKLDAYVKMGHLLHTKETSYSVVRANQFEAYKNESDEKYLFFSDVFIAQENAQRETPLEVLYTQPIERPIPQS